MVLVVVAAVLDGAEAVVLAEEEPAPGGGGGGRRLLIAPPPPPPAIADVGFNAVDGFGGDVAALKKASSDEDGGSELIVQCPDCLSYSSRRKTTAKNWIDSQYHATQGSIPNPYSLSLTHHPAVGVVWSLSSYAFKGERYGSGVLLVSIYLFILFHERLYIYLCFCTRYRTADTVSHFRRSMMML